MTDSKNSALQRIISAFNGAKASDKSWRGACPVCHHNSLLIEVGKDSPVVAWCSRECDKAQVNAAIYKVANIKREPFTVERFCQIKHLPEHWVSAHFLLHNGEFKTKSGRLSPAVVFPYIGEPRITRTETQEIWERIPPDGARKFRFSEDSHKTAWGKDYTPMLYGLHMVPYYKDNAIDTSAVVLCEGESDTITLAYAGIPAFGISGAPHGWKSEYAKQPVLENAKRILVIQEPDDAGQKLVEKIARCFPAGKVWVVKLPAKDPSELWINSKTDEDFAAAWKAAVSAAVPVGAAAEGEREYTVEKLSSIAPKPLTWLWPGRIPRGKITIFGGNPGVGKGLATCSLAAIVTTGRMFPDEAISDRPPMDVLMLFCEDDAEDTVVPRLMAAGADLERIYRIKAQAIIGTGDKATKIERELAFDSDLKLLKRFLTEHPEVQLVIVDPISSYLGNIKPNDEKQLRDVLVPLADLGRETGVTFVLVAHFNKRSDVNALHKVLGAVAMTGVARSAWLFAEDKDCEDGERFLMLQGKLNLGRKQKGIEYTIGEKQVLPPPGESTGVIVWGGVTDVTAEKALGSVAAFGDDGGSKVKRAGEFLQQYLADGDKPAKEVYAAAKAAGIGERTLGTAKKEAGVQSHKVLDQWLWRWPVDIETQAGLQP